MRRSRGGTLVRTPPPLENHKHIGFLNITGSDPKNHKVSVLYLYFAVPWVGQWCVSVAFSGHTHVFGTLLG